MPRDAFISIFGLAALDGFCYGMNIASTMGEGRTLNGQMLFYSSMFQAGLDRIVVSDEVPSGMRNQIPQHRLKVLDSGYMRVFSSLNAYFNSYLEANWRQKPQHAETRALLYALTDLLVSFRLRRPLLRTISMPDLRPLRATLPLEILLPIEKLFAAFETHNSTVALPLKKVPKDRIAVFEEIMTSAAYSTVLEKHDQLLAAHVALRESVGQLEHANQELYWKWKDFLQLKSSLIRIGRNIPEVVDAAFEAARGCSQADRRSVGRKPQPEFWRSYIRWGSDPRRRVARACSAKQGS